MFALTGGSHVEMPNYDSESIKYVDNIFNMDLSICALLDVSQAFKFS